MGASREEIAAEAMKANDAYDQAKRQVTEFRTLADVSEDESAHLQCESTDLEPCSDLQEHPSTS